jgi:hypothetical protein
MANKPVTTLGNLRQSICGELNMKFYKRYLDHSTFTGGSPVTPIDTSLTQAPDYWNNGWLLVTSGSNNQQVRMITDFAGGALTLERALTATPTGGTYEILDVFSPYEVHRAINRSLNDAFPAFYDVNTDEDTLIVQEDKLTYDLTALSPRPWIPLTVEIEPGAATLGIVTTTSASGIIDSTTSFDSDINADFKVSIYGGTGAGQISQVVSRTSATQLTVSSGWIPALDSTSKYAVWDATDEDDTWRWLKAVRFDQKQYPSKMYLPPGLDSWNGMRIRFQYSATPSDLTCDSDETVVPKEFVVHKAISILAGMKLNDSRVDRDRYRDLEERHAARAQLIKDREAWQPPDVTMWQEYSGNGSQDLDNPLDW